MRPFLTLWLCLVLLFSAACSMLTPQQRDNARGTVEQEYLAGNLTRAQRDAAIEALDNDEPFDWTTLGVVGINLAMALVGGPMVVRYQRGKPTQKVGIPASKVKAGC
jgi:hypothetical protein